MKKLMFLCMLGGIIFALNHVDANAQQAQRVKSDIEQPSKQEKVVNSNVVKTTNPTVQQKEAKPITTVLPTNGKAGSCAIAAPQTKVTEIPKGEEFEELYAGEREFMENLKKENEMQYRQYALERHSLKEEFLMGKEKRNLSSADWEMMVDQFKAKFGL